MVVKTYIIIPSTIIRDEEATKEEIKKLGQELLMEKIFQI